MNHPPQLHVATYHYVRDLPRTRSRRSRECFWTIFAGRRKPCPDVFEMATLESAMEFLTGKYTPRRDLCLMTFDDGLREHYADVTPILAEEQIQGLFFLISGCLEDGVVAPVHMNHFLMAHLGFRDVSRRVSRRRCGNLGFDEQSDAEAGSGDLPANLSARYAGSRAIQIPFQFCAAPAIRDLAVKKLFREVSGRRKGVWRRSSI